MMHNKMYKMSVFWVSRFGPCCEINLEVESRAQEAAGRAQEPWQFHQLLSGVPWYIYTQISISGRSIFGPGLQIFGCCERDNKWRKITIYVQYTIQYSPLPTSNGIWSFLFYVWSDARICAILASVPLFASSCDSLFCASLTRWREKWRESPVPLPY